MKRLSILLAICLLSACMTPAAPIDETPEGPSQETAAALSSSQGNQCATITQAAVDGVQQVIQQGIAEANTNLAAFGSDPYAQYLKDELEAANDEVAKAKSDITQYDPTTGSYPGAAGNVMVYMERAIGHLTTARWCASISSIYDHSCMARASFEYVSQAIELANDLAARSGRCYVEAWLPVSSCPALP